LESCFACPAGFYCPNVATITPKLCQNGTYCPEGSYTYTYCPSGFYCPAGSADPIVCPPGYYCPGDSEYYYKCANGTYCHEGSEFPTFCPGGTYGSGNPENFDIESGCDACGRGLYSETGDYQCIDCTAGYVCLGNTSSSTPQNLLIENGYPCPVGHYCPTGSYLETQCPAGTYAKFQGTEFEEDCVKCKVDYYNDLTGQAGCKKCGPTSETDESGGATTCTCKGLNRKFQIETGTCLCESGYIPKNGQADYDSSEDCELIIVNVCTVDQSVDINGNCLSQEDTVQYCIDICGEDGGVIIEGSGLCECNVIQDVDTVCDSTCRSTEIQATVTSSGIVELYDPVTEITSSVDPSTINGTFGNFRVGNDASNSSANLVSLAATSDGTMTYDYSTSEAVLAAAGVQSNSDRSSTRLRRMRSNKLRNLQDVDANTAITNPTMCLSLGSTVLFSVSYDETLD